MFNAATGRIRLNWKVLAGLTGAVLMIMLISYLGPEEQKAVAATTASGPTGSGARAEVPTPEAMERMRAAARASAGQSPASRPAMVEEPVRSREQLVTAAPASRPAGLVPSQPGMPPVRPQPGMPPMPVTAPNQNPGGVAMPPSAQPRPAMPAPAAVGAASAAANPPVAPAVTPAPVAAAEPAAPAPEPAAADAPSEVEPDAGALAADVASQPVEGGSGASQAEYMTKTYNFNLKGAEWKDVLEYFSRHTKLSIIGDTQDLTGTVDFYHATPMTFRQAFRFFNRLLASQPQQRIALLRKDHIQIVKVTGSTAWQRYLDLDRIFDGYDAFKAADLPEDEKCVIFYTPQQADGPSLVDMYRPFAPDYMIIQPVGDSNELMVAGQAADVDRWLQLVQRPIVEDLRQTRKFVLKNSQANDVRNMLTALFPVQGNASPRPAAQPGQPAVSTPRIASDKIDIWADDKSNMVIIKATPRKLDEIARMIETVDVETLDDTTVQVYKLRHARAEDLANTLRQLFTAASTPRPGGKQGSGWWRRSGGGSSVAVQVFGDGATNSLLVLADKDAQQEARNLIDRFDVEDSAGQMLRIPLTNARAEQVVQVLQQVFAPMMKQTAKGPAMTLAADTGNNAVVAAGDPQLLTKVQEAVKQFDAEDNQAIEHVVRLEHVKPSEVANALTGIFTIKQGQSGAVTRFLPIEAAGTIVVVAPPNDWERIEPMINLIDKQAQISSPQVKTVVLQHADANVVANILNQAAQTQAQRSPGAALTRAYGDPRTSQVCVQATPENFIEVQALIKQLDVADAQGGTVVITLQNADAVLAAQNLQPMANRTSVPGGQPVQIAAEPMTNSVIVRNADKADLTQIRDILTRMDGAVGTITTRTFRPKFIDAGDLSAVLTNLYVNVQGKQPGTTGVKVVASPGAVSVDAPSDVMAKITRKIEELDVPSPLAGDPLIIPLQNADPKELANTLNTMYSKGPKGPIAQFGVSGQALVVQAGEAAREGIAQIVKNLDVAGNQGNTEVIPLERADASLVAQSLQQWMANRPSQPGGQPLQVVGEPLTNSIVIRNASKNELAQVKELLAKMDTAAGTITSQTFKLKYMDAGDLVNILNTQYVNLPGKPAGSSGVKVAAGPGAVSVDAPADVMARIAKKISELDVPAPLTGAPLVIEVKNGDAKELANTLNILYSKGAKGPAAQFQANGQTLAVQAPEALREDILQTVKNLDKPADDSDMATQVVPLANAQAADVAKMLQEGLGSVPGKPGGLTRVRISASQAGNTLLLSGPKGDVAKVVAMAQEIEENTGKNGTVTRSYMLTSASASDVAKTLEKVAAAAGGKDVVKVSSDERSNTVFISGPAGRFVEIDKIIKTMDSSDIGPTMQDIDIMTVTVKRGDPFDIAYKAQKVLDAKYGKGAPTVDSDFGSPTITITGKKETFKKAQDVIDSLVEGEPPAKRRIAVRNTKVPAEQMLKALNEYASEYVTGAIRVEQAGGHNNIKPEDLNLKRLSPQLRPQQVVPQQIDARSGSPTSAAPATRPASSDRIRPGAGAPLGMGPVISALQAIALGQTAAAPASRPRAASVSLAPATPAAGAQAAEPEESEVVVKIDPETQQLVVVGTSNQIDQIDELLKMIEEAYKAGDDDAFLIKVYQLQYLNATSAAQALEQVFNDAPVAIPQPPQPQPGQPGQPPQPNQPPQQGQQVQQVSQPRGGDTGTGGRQRGGQQGRQQQQQQMMAGGKQRIRAIADLRVNAVIVRCVPQDIMKVEQFLSTIDRQSEITQVFRTWPIKNLKASEVERVIKEVMRMGGTKGGSTPATPTPTAPGQQAVTILRDQLIALNFGNSKGGAAGAPLSSPDSVTVTSEDTSNTLYASGPEVFLNVIDEFVKTMETTAGDNTPRVFNLVRARSADVARALQGFFPQAAGQGAGKGSGPTIVSDDRSNMLLVSASSADMTKIEAVVNAMEGPKGSNSSVIVRVLRATPEDIQKVVDQIQGVSNTSSSSGGQSRTVYQPPQSTSYSPPGPPQGQRQFGGQGQGQGQGGRQPRRGGGGGAGGSAASPAQPSSDASDADDAGNATGDAGSAIQSEPNKYELSGWHATACTEPVEAGLSEGPATHAGAPSFWAIPAVVSSLMLSQVAPAQPGEADQSPAATQPAPESETPEGQPQGVQAPPEATPPPGAEPGPEAPAAGQPAPAEPPVGGAIPLRPQAPTGEPMIPSFQSRAIRPPQTQPAATQPAPAQALPPLTSEQIEQIRTGQIRVTPIGPNEVVIEGPEESVAAMEALIRRMEEGAPPPIMRIIPLKNAQAQPLAQQLTTMFQQIQPAGRTPRPEDKVTIVADTRSNSLIVAAQPERLAEVESLVKNLDAKPVIAEVEYKTYPLKHIQASEAATMLQDLLKKLQQQRGVQGEQFTITPDDRTNTLIVTAPKSDLAQLESLIGTLDVPPAFATAEMMIYPLHNVTSKDLVTVLNDMISAQISRPGGGGGGGGGAGGARPGAAGSTETIRRLKLRTAEGKELPELDLEKPIKIISEPNTNSVVVSSTPDNLAAMNDVVKLLDNYPVGESVRVWVFPLQYADATELATQLTKTFQDGRSVGVRAAPQGGQAQVVAGVPPTPAGQAMMFTAVIMADARTNTLMVAGRQQALDLADQIIAKLDRPGQISKFPIHIVRLDNNDATTVAPLLEKVFTQQAGGSKALADKVSIIPEPGTNALLIAANSENFKILQGLVTDLDTFPEVQNLVRTFVLQNADAAQVADTLKNLFSQPIYRQGITLPGAAGEKAQKVTIQSDPRTNSVIISAKKENWPLIEELMKQMDSPATPFPLMGNFAVVQMHNTDAGKVAGTLTDLMDQINKAKTTGGGKVTQVPPVIIADSRTNSLLVFGPGPIIEQVQTLATRLDQPSNMPTAEMKVYPLKQASPDQMEAVINDLFQRRGGAGGGGGAAGAGAGAAAGKGATQMQVYADAASNSLVVYASPEDQSLIAKLLDMLDVPNQTAVQVELFPLEKAQAQTIVQLLQSLYTMRSATGGGGGGANAAAGGAPGGGARTGSATGVTFTADDRSNSVVVRAAPADMRNIKDLIHRLDSAEVQTEMGMRWVQLKRADATDMAQLLTNFLQAQGTTGTGGYGGGYGGGYTGGGGGTSSQSQARLISFKQQNPKGEDVLRHLLQQGIRITPDARTNTLIVMAPPDSVDVLVALIESLDSISPVNVEIEIFQLQNADATETQTTLEQLFGVGKGATGTGTTGRGGTGTTAQEQRNLMLAQQGLGGGLPGGVAPGAALTPGAIPGLGGFGGVGLMGGLTGLESLGGGPATAGGRPILSFTTDTRTNSVIAAGAADYLALVRQLIEQLDSQEMSQRRPIVYAVKYAPSTQLATDLSTYFKAETTRLDELKQDVPAQLRMEQEVTVTNATNTNKLLISVSPRYEAQVMEMIRSLDQQPPMVMIQVLIAEVTLDNRIEWGFEFASQDLHFTKTGSGSNVVAGTSLGAAGTGTGFTFSLTGEDFSLLLHTLQSESRVQVLSRPQIMVLDNQEAYIQVGDQVPTVSNSTVTTTGQLQTFVTNQNTGVILTVTPHITPDDFVRMLVAPEISALSPSTVQISQGLSAPIITQRKASSTVTVKNGETVVIGGLIRSSRGVSDTKVPILGDIPIVGYLFKSQNLTESRDELLIVLTPRIVRTVEDANNLSIEQRDVGNLIPYQTKRSPLWQKLQVITPSAPPVPGHPGEPTGPATQPSMYGPQPIQYGPQAPAALMQEDRTAPRQDSGARSSQATNEATDQNEPVSYLEQRR